MQFTVYTLGDVSLFESAFQGVAMMFTVASGGTMDIWASNSGWGLGMGALLGSLMALLIMVYNGAMKRQLDWRTLLAPLLLYFVLTVPKATVVVVDAYSKQAPRHVDNVPFGLAFPMGVISQIAYGATEKLETIFYVPYSGYTKITSEGYVAPLKLLNAIRYTGLTASGAMPNLQGAVNEAYHVCLTNNDAFSENDYHNSIDSLDVFVKALQSTNVENRYVRVPTANQGMQVMSCANVATYIKEGIDAYITGNNNGLFKMLTNEQLKTSNMQKDAVKIQTGQSGSKQGLPDMTTAKIIETISNMAQADNVTIMAFMQQTILNPTLSAVSECAIDNDPTSQGRCSSYYTSVEQGKEKAAADASGFVAIMRDGQNLLIVLSVILFPIMVVILVLQGQSAMKILGSYILYTVSAFMWLPVAAMINFYTHLQLHEELEKWNPTKDPTVFLSLKNAPAFYDAVSKKLALANHALASVPMLCMGIFSGMLMTMNRLSDRWNTQSQYYDPKTNVPDAVKRGPIAEVGPSYSASGMNNVMTQNGVGQAWTAEASKEMSNTLSQVKALEEKNSSIISAEWKKTGATLDDVTQQKSMIRSSMEGKEFSNMSSAQKDQATEAYLSELSGTALNNSRSSGLGNTGNKIDAQTNTFSIQGSLGATGGLKKDNQGQTSAAAGVSPSVSGTGAINYSNGTQAIEQKTNANSVDRIHNEGNSSSFKDGESVRSGMSNQQKHAFQRNLSAQMSDMVTNKTSQTHSENKGKQVSQAHAELLSNQEAIQQKTGMAFKQSMSSTEMANRQKNNETFAKNADQIYRNVMSTEAGREQFNQARRNFLNQGSAETAILNQQGGERLVNNIVAMQVASSQGSTEALQLFSNLDAPKSVDPNAKTSMGLKEQNEPHIASAQNAGLEAQAQTKNLSAKLNQQMNGIGGAVDATYKKQSDAANTPVTPYGKEIATNAQQEHIAKVADKDQQNLIAKATNDLDPNAQYNKDYLAKHGSLPPESK